MTVDVAPEIVDRLMAFYCDWREECLETHDAYERFKVAAPRIATSRLPPTRPRSTAKKRPARCTPGRSGR